MEAKEEEKEKEGKKGEGEKETYGSQGSMGDSQGLGGHAEAMMSCKGNLGAWEEWKRVFGEGGHSKLTWLHLGQSLF